MRLWKKAAGALKDRNSIWIASFSPRNNYRNPYLEQLIIKATSHDETHLDYENVQRVFKWLNTSPSYLKPFLWNLSTRLEKTRCWVVALKGLILVHGVFCLDVPGLHKIGRLPFDLSNFSDGHAKPEKAWGYNLFVRSYFAYLDQRSAIMASEANKQGKEDEEESVMDELEKLQKLQRLLDILMQIRPHPETVKTRNVLIETMDHVLIDIFIICRAIFYGMARVVLRICKDGRKLEASLALKILDKAANQEDDLSLYSEFCRDIGVLNASKCPNVERISEEDILELKRISNGEPQKLNLIQYHDQEDFIVDNDKALVVRGNRETVELKRDSSLVSLITYKWEVFDEDTSKGTTVPEPVRQITQWPTCKIDLPDLISL